MSVERRQEATVLAVDIGGTWLRVGVASEGSTVELRLRTEVPGSLDEFLRVVAEQVPSLTAERPVVAGVAVPGLVDGTRCRWVPNVPYLDGVDLRAVFADLGVPEVSVGNDAHLSLVAEHAEGVARDVDDAVLVAIGTGIGSAVLAGGRIVLGAGGGACSFGWASAAIDDEVVPGRGWLERQASGVAFDRMAASLDGGWQGADLIRAAATDARAAALLDTAAAALGTALAGAVALLDPAMVIVSGGVVAAADELLPRIRPRLERQLPTHLRRVPIVAGDLGADAAIRGAAVAARRGARWWQA